MACTETRKGRSLLSLIRGAPGANAYTAQAPQTTSDLLHTRLFTASPHIWLHVVLSIACKRMTGSQLPLELFNFIVYRYKGLAHPVVVLLANNENLQTFIHEDKNDISCLQFAGCCTCGGNWGCPTWKWPVDRAADYLMAQNQGIKITITKPMVCHIANASRRRACWMSRNFETEDELPRQYDISDSRIRMAVTTSCSLERLWRLYYKRRDGLNDSKYYYRFEQFEFLEPDFLGNASRKAVRQMIGNAHGVAAPRIRGEDYISKQEWVQAYYNSLRGKEDQLIDWPRHNWARRNLKEK